MFRITKTIGGGGLASGIALTAKRIRPGIEIIGVQADLFPSFHNLFHSGDRPVGGMTLAEGIAVKEPAKGNLEVIKKLVSRVEVANEHEIEESIFDLLSEEKLVAEGAVVATIGGRELRAPFDGRVRGLIHPSVELTEGMKVGDVDPRGPDVDPTRISDKALAIGGGVLEALLALKVIPTERGAD